METEVKGKMTKEYNDGDERGIETRLEGKLSRNDSST